MTDSSPTASVPPAALGRPLLTALLLALAAFAFLAPACGGGGGGGGSTNSPAGANAQVGAAVDIKNNAFNPATVIIRSGQSVRWTFDDGTKAHNVIGNGFRSDDRTTGTFSHQFASPGTYDYQCSIHAGMTGHVIATP